MEQFGTRILRRFHNVFSFEMVFYLIARELTYLPDGIGRREFAGAASASRPSGLKLCRAGPRDEEQIEIVHRECSMRIFIPEQT